MRTYLLSPCVAFLGFSCVLFAQAPQGQPPKPDSELVKADIEKAKRIAGTDWAMTAHFLCEAPHANRPDDPLLEPTKIFDNVYVIGRTGTAVYAITTSAGILLIDSGYQADVENVLLAGMKKLGLDPALVKIVVVGHGHSDHFGGTAYFQQHGARIYVSEADWDIVEHPPAGGKEPPPPLLTKRDMVLADGQSVSLGDVKLTAFAIPGHTPGSMGFIFPVKDGGKTRVAGLYGGTIMGAGVISDDGLQQYMRSLAHFEEAAERAKVEVELQNHPLFDGLPDKLEKLKNRKPGEPNPFVVGQGSYQRFLDVMSACMQANIDRRK